jgi:hypothetical protein
MGTLTIAHVQRSSTGQERQDDIQKCLGVLRVQAMAVAEVVGAGMDESGGEQADSLRDSAIIVAGQQQAGRVYTV